ncbi:MAG TPA: hypothetical protein VKM55_28475 [Candidatus Lokiarchaeia archaeon]|nr:hypothetical protein [Candidatus Lokiarchaeia archaeon]
MPIKKSWEKTKDVLQGFSMKAERLSSDKQYLKMNGDKITKPVVEYGSELILVFTGVTGFEEKDDKVFLGASLSVENEHGREVMSRDDLFERYTETGIDPKDAETISLAITLKYPLVGACKYTWKMCVWDKVGTGEILAEQALNVVYPVSLVSVQDSDLSVTGAGLFLYREFLSKSEIKFGQDVNCVLSNITGFTPRDDRFFFGASMSVIDSSGVEVFKTGDLLEENGDKGMDPDEIHPLTVTLTAGSPLKGGSSYKWTIRVWDKNSSNKLLASIDDLKVLKNETPLEITCDGLESADQAILVDGDWVPDLDVRENQAIKVCFANLSGFSVQEGKIFPGAEISAFDTDENLIVNTGDVFEDEEAGLDADTDQINLKCNSQDPLKPGNQYELQFRIWDKKSDAVLKARIKIKIREE